MPFLLIYMLNIGLKEIPTTESGLFNLKAFIFILQKYIFFTIVFNSCLVV